MALVLKDRVRESSTSSGTGSITLAGAYTGYQTFASAIASGSTVYYTIHNTTSPNDGEWEVGVGTFTSPSTLSRDTVFSSSTGGSKVSFSGSSTLEVFITQPAEQAVYINDATGKVEAFGNGTNTITFTEINTTNLTANTVTLTAGTISTNAASATDIVNKQYVDGIVAAGVHYHEPVLVESPTSLTATYNQPGGAGNGVGATLTNSGANAALVIDGVTLSNTARVLVYTQSNAVQNGIYTVTNEGAPDSPGPGAQWVLTRATDADTYVVASSAGLSEGSTVYVQSGDTGAGEVYTCNTQGTITFGTTNITFAQIGSAQVYSAGTGLSLTNTTFSISNTAVTAAQYGNDGNVAQITVNAQGQLTNAANVAINASSITVGTLANARTTASDANGASTIVARDATGSFTANTITATDVNSTNVTATTGSFTNVSGNGSAISAINASNISSGTIANARTTASSANGASTIVARDANGDFAADAITANFFIGDGSNVSAINGSNVTTGTIANARTTAATANGASTIVLRGTSGEFSAGAITGSSFTGDGSALSSMNASNLSAGTVNTARISGSYTGITGVGTLTAGTWNANTVGAQYGGTGSANLTANNVILGNGASAVQFVAPGTSGNVLTSNGTTWTSAAAGGGFASGTVMLFGQTAAPTGWTKDATNFNNSALRVVTGTVSSGGTVDFTTAFVSQSVTGTVSTTVNATTATNQATTATNQATTATNQATTATNQSYTPAGSVSITSVSGSAGSTTLTTPQIPAHSHNIPNAGSTSGGGKAGSGNDAPEGNINTNNTGGDGGHTHPFSFSSGSGTFSGTPATVTQDSHNHTQNSHNHTQDAHNHTQDSHTHTASSSFSGTAINLAVKYVDVIRATKD